MAASKVYAHDALVANTINLQVRRPFDALWNSMIMNRLSRLFRAFREAGRPEFPDDTRIYAVGDIHGRLDLLRLIGAAIEADVRDRPIPRITEIFLGDYVDRGPDSRGVIDWLRRPPGHDGARICLKGNHEETLLAFLDDPAVFDLWRRFGGLETLISYGVELPARPAGAQAEEIASQFRALLPSAHKAFLRDMPTMHMAGGYVFVHAGLRPGVQPELQSDQDRLWIREDFLESTADFGRLIVHGHTPVDTVELLPNRIDIDTGAHMTHCLSCLVIEASGLRLIQTGRAGIKHAPLVVW